MRSSPSKLLIPEYSPTVVDVDATELDAVAISAFMIVPLAPLESVIVTFLLLKSIGLSFIILSPASVESESVPSRTMSPSPVSSSNNNLLAPSVPSASVPSSIMLLPAFSVASCSFSPKPSELIPSNNSLPFKSTSRTRSIRTLPPTS